MFKSALVVLGGFGVMTAATILLFALLGRLAPAQFSPGAASPPSTPMILVVLTGGLLSAMAGGWLTGRIAADAVWAHVLSLAGLVLAMGLLTLFLEAEHPAPLWYRLALPVVGVGGVLLGGRLA